MMLRVLFLMLLVLSSLILGPYMAGNQGYVRIETATKVYEMSIVMLVVFFAISMGILYLLEWVITRFFRLSRGSYHWFGNRKRSQAHKQTLQGLMKIAEGDYAKAEKLISRNAKHSDEPILSFIKAAEAAQKQGDDLSANKYLLEASKLAGANNIAVELTRTRLLLQQGKLPAARSAVDSLLVLSPNNVDARRLAIQIYQRLKSYKALDALLEQIGKRSFLSAEEYEYLEQQVIDGLLDEVMADKGQEGLLTWWENQSSQRRRIVYVRAALIKRLLDTDDHQSAADIALETIKKYTDEQLPYLFPQLTRLQLDEGAKVVKLLAKRETKAEMHYRDDYARALGYIYARQGLFQQAKPYFVQLLDHQECTANDRIMALYVAEQTQDSALVSEIRHQNLKQIQLTGNTSPLVALPESV